MAVLSNPVLKVNSVDLTGFCTAATLTRQFDALDDTVFGQTYRTSTAGLENNQLTCSLFMSYGAGEVYATLKDLVGTKTTVRVQPTNAVDSATNPGFILTNTFLAALPVLNASLGELQTIELTFTGGAYSADTTNP